MRLPWQIAFLASAPYYSFTQWVIGIFEKENEQLFVECGSRARMARGETAEEFSPFILNWLGKYTRKVGFFKVSPLKMGLLKPPLKPTPC